MIGTQTALDELVAALEPQAQIAVDTEFVREKTYYPKLCLIQIATHDSVACIDCLAQLDLQPFYARLFRTNCTWVLHSARQDLEVVWLATQRLPPSLVDTQIAAALIGFAPQIGLEGLLARTLQVTLGESYARTDWSRRPLPPAALAYALDDVRYLLPAWAHLEERLSALGRLAWFEEDSRRALAERPVADAPAVWARVKGVQGLPFAAQCAALGLVRWRELAAQRADRPRRWILDDETLLALAGALPQTVDDLAGLVPERLAARHGVALLGALAAREEPEAQAIVRAAAAQAAPDKKRVKSLQEDVRRRAAELGIEPEILATRRDLAALAVGSAPRHLRGGWRAAELERIASAQVAPGT